MRIFVLFTVCLFSAFFVTGCGVDQKKLDKAHAKMCAANMRLMTGSIEMYNMDNSVMLKDVNSEMFQEGGLIIKAKYLKQPITMPSEKCAYMFTGDFAKVDAGVITCKSHGTLKDIDNNFK